MTPTPKSFIPAIAAAEQARLHPAGALPKLTHQSPPVPVRGLKGGLQFLFFYARAEAIEPADGVQLWPPSYVAAINAANGRFDELRAVKPGDFGVRKAPDQPLGRLPATTNESDALAKQIRWFQAYDTLIPFFAARTYGLSADQQRDAQEFLRLTPEVLEGPLMPYFERAAAEFFDWLTLLRR